MKTNNKIFRIVLFQLVLLCFVCSGAFAQDASLTQAYANPILLNPAILGANGDLQVIANYKNQLADIQKGYTSSSLGILYPLYVNDNHRKFDLGLNLQNDVAGAFRKHHRPHKGRTAVQRRIQRFRRGQATDLGGGHGAMTSRPSPRAAAAISASSVASL